MLLDGKSIRVPMSHVGLIAQFKKSKKGDANDERLVQILTSKFVLDTWCLNYKSETKQCNTVGFIA